ncbi:MAG: ATP-grasp domain-containing protein, partial [Gemmataceae bacterium]
MKIHEYQAKELLAAAGAPVPRGVVVSTPDEATRAFEALGGPVVIKAQIHAGGRGKGGFKGSKYLPGDSKEDGPKLGGVKFLTKKEDIGPVAEVYFNYPLVTLQTGAEGQRVAKALVVEAKDKIVKEYYVGMVLDRAAGL